jgi:RNA polymerase sigma-70 factor, ECF subfamily
MSETDKEIIQRVLDGEVQAFGTLVDRHSAKAMILAVRILRNREDAEEALQDAFVRMYRALPSFEWKASFSTWLYRIVYNTCITAAGRKDSTFRMSIDAQQEDGETQFEIASDDLLPDTLLESAEIETIVTEEIERLPPQYSSTFTLFVIQDMSYDEIVQVMGLPLGTVKARIFRARTLLRQALAKRLEVSLT